MKTIAKEELSILLGKRTDGKLDLRKYSFQNMDLSGWKLNDVDFRDSDFVNIILNRADLRQSDLRHTMFAPGCSFHQADLCDADISGAICRRCDFSESNMAGANLYRSNFEGSNMSRIKTDDRTRYYRMRCPAEGAFLGYKRCFNDSLVQLLIPADARRSSATGNSCRCDRAKVLSITTFDGSKKLPEAWSVVNEDFVYRVGEYVSAADFDEDRWMDSTTGIHFWMTREEAYSYLE